MKNEEMKKPVPVELDDEKLDKISGGAAGIAEGDAGVIAAHYCGGVMGKIYAQSAGNGDPVIRNCINLDQAGELA